MHNTTAGNAPAETPCNEKVGAGETATHTPGPWEIWDARIVSGNQEVCALAASPVPGGFSLNGETYANGFLITAAPDLLAALQAVANALEWHEDRMPKGQDSGALDLARAAIAKAKGRP